jgi:hypothetical protein
MRSHAPRCVVAQGQFRDAECARLALCGSADDRCGYVEQQRNVLEYLTAACEAARRDAPAPSLLPAFRERPSDQGAA